MVPLLFLHCYFFLKVSNINFGEISKLSPQSPVLPLNLFPKKAFLTSLMFPPLPSNIKHLIEPFTYLYSQFPVDYETKYILKFSPLCHFQDNF